MASTRGTYEVQSLEWLEDDKLMLLESWARDGYTYHDIAEKIGISDRCLSLWRKKHPEINKALSKGREIVDYQVENALLKSALGFTVKETKVIITTDRKNGDVVTTTRETTTKEIAPNVTACQVWLYNRLPNKWKRNRDKLIDVPDEDQTIQVTVTRAGKKRVGDDVNEQVTIMPATKQSNEDLDYWPDDWDGDDDANS